MARLSGRTSLVFVDVFGVEFFKFFFIRINFLQCTRKFIGAHRCGRGDLPAAVLFSFHTIIIPHIAGCYTQKCAFGRKLSNLLYLVAPQYKIACLVRHRPHCHFYSPFILTEHFFCYFAHVFSMSFRPKAHSCAVVEKSRSSAISISLSF